MSDEIGVKIKATTEGVSDAAQQVKSLGEGAESIVENFKGLAAALGAAFSVDAAHEFLKSMEETAEQLERLKNITGLSTSTLQDMQNQMRLTGGDSETAAQGMVRFERSVYDAAAGSGPAFEAFKKLGVSWDDLKHNSIEDILEILATPLLGIIPESQDVLRASNVGSPVTLNNAASAPARAYMDAARRLKGETVTMMVPTERAGLMNRLLGRRAA